MLMPYVPVNIFSHIRMFSIVRSSRSSSECDGSFKISGMKIVNATKIYIHRILASAHTFKHAILLIYFHMENIFFGTVLYLVLLKPIICRFS